MSSVVPISSMIFQLSYTGVAFNMGVEHSFSSSRGESAVGSRDRSLKSISTSLVDDVTGVVEVVLSGVEQWFRLGGVVTGLV